MSIPDIIHGIHALVALFFIVGGLLYCIFCPWNSLEIAGAGAILATYLMIYGLISRLQKCKNIDSGTNDEVLLERCRTNLLIGSGLGLIAGWFPRLVVYAAMTLIPYDTGILWCCIFMTIPLIPLFWTQFIWTSKRHCRVVYKMREAQPWLILAFNFFLLMKMFGMHDHYRDRETKKIYWTQVIFFPICTACMIEFVQVWQGKLELTHPEPECSGNVLILEKNAEFAIPNKLKNGAVENERSVAQILGETDLRFQCKICHEDYSNPSKTPRILKECGHTICEKCADNLLNNGQHLFCPFCQKVTVVGDYCSLKEGYCRRYCISGKANLLPKNFAVLEMME